MKGKGKREGENKGREGEERQSKSIGGKREEVGTMREGGRKEMREA